MKIAFIHYHLKTGGVTTVLRQQVEAIHGACEVLVLTSTPPPTDYPVDVLLIPGLGYTGQTLPASNPEDIAESISQAIFSKWKDGCDLIHVRNPTLAKNIYFLKILKALKKRHFKLFLQIHDFAEDGRPGVYFHEDYIKDCHYGVINSRDYHILLSAGLKKTGLHKIFNTIRRLDAISNPETPSDRILYPIRAIRRKNIGEAILLSLFFYNGETLSITQPPNSPADVKAYSLWKTFVKEKRLNVIFDEGLRCNFNTLVGSSKFIVTTSITEGFGFSFLEPWTAGKLLWGRKLPDICRDFEQNGIRLDHLYTQLNIPIDWLDEKKVFRIWKTCVLKTSSLFNCTLKPEKLREDFSRLIQDGTIDFGRLNESLQKKVISRVQSSKKSFQYLITLNPFLSHPGDVADQNALIHHNKHIIERTYTIARYKETLLGIYENVRKYPVRHSIDKHRLLWMFFNPNNFSLLKWCDDVE